MDDESRIRLKAAATYNAAADHYDHAPLGFWERHGRHAVELLQLSPGSCVLDVGCGMGASALPAAEAVGPHGHVTAIDLAQNMLAGACAKARARGLDNLAFEMADMTALKVPDRSLDAVISVFSLFFIPDMERQIAALWRMVRPGGQLAVTVWGPRAFEPGASIFSEEVLRVRPDSAVSVRPWERLTDRDNLRQLFRDGGLPEPRISEVDDRQPLSQSSDWWVMAMGSGYRWEIDQLSALDRERIREQNLRRLSEQAIQEIETTALHAIARRPY